MIALTPQVLQLVLLGIQVAPELIAAAQQEIALFNSGKTPTPEETAAIEAALDAAHKALQAAGPSV